jgi:pimeloyl-ACP methyl ester carboxylesterase
MKENIKKRPNTTKAFMLCLFAGYCAVMPRLLAQNTLALPTLSVPTALTAPMLAKQDFFTQSDNGIKIFIREIKPQGIATSQQIPILLVHGGGGSGLACFDLDTNEDSFAEELAHKAQCAVYVVDVRGWGKSTRPKAMNAPPEKNKPLVTSNEAAHDVAAAILAVSKRNGGERVTVMGWASGGHWAGYALTHIKNLEFFVGKLVLFNTVYGTQGAWPLAESTGDTLSKKSQGAYRLATAENLITRWNASIPDSLRAVWHTSGVDTAYAQAALDADPTSRKRTPPSVRIPLAYWYEHLRLARGEKLWQATDIRVPTLVVRGQLDYWSRHADGIALINELQNAPIKRLAVLPQGTHFAFLDAPERGRTQLVQEILAFPSFRNQPQAIPKQAQKADKKK